MLNEHLLDFVGALDHHIEALLGCQRHEILELKVEFAFRVIVVEYQYRRHL